MAHNGTCLSRNSLKRTFSRRGEKARDVPNLDWIEAADNPWGIRVLDVRPITLGMLSSSANAECASNAVSFRQDDGRSFATPLKRNR